MNESNAREEVLRQLFDLAFGPGGGDAARLAFGEAPEGLDLRMLAGVHSSGNGGVEVKLLDRVRLIELLLAATEPKAVPDTAAGLISALERSAGRLGEAAGGDGTDS